jgi:biotin operon repressor|tara:strand:+ start:133 stop:702 length:570 start_codon:yes stop_codon:yes gene_type:complete
MTEKIKPLTQIQKKYLKERVDDIVNSFNRQMERADDDIKPPLIEENKTLFKALKTGDLDWIHDTHIVSMIKTKVNQGDFSTYYSNRIGTVELSLIDLIVGVDDFARKRKEIASAQEKAKREIKNQYRLKAETLTDKAILEGTDISEQIDIFRIECNKAVEQFVQEWKHVDTWEKEGNEINMADASEIMS